MKLSDWPLPYVRVQCLQCDRLGKISHDRLVSRFGADRSMVEVRTTLTENCDRPDKKLPCLSILPDALLVHTILDVDEVDVIKPELLAQAREWRSKLEKD